jgi:hypothetical protein
MDRAKHSSKQIPRNKEESFFLSEQVKFAESIPSPTTTNQSLSDTSIATEFTPVDRIYFLSTSTY